METNNFLADHVDVSRPVLLERLLRAGVSRAISDRGEVISQSVEPDVNHMLRVVGHRDAPGKGRAADRQVAQTGADERNYFVAARLRPNEFRIRIELQQLVLKRRELEEVILFVNGFSDAAASRAEIAGLRAIDIKFARYAILASVRTFVNVAVVPNSSKQFLH